MTFTGTGTVPSTSGGVGCFIDTAGFGSKIGKYVRIIKIYWLRPPYECVFYYKEGETLNFSIGSLVLGSAVGKSVITLLDIVPDAASNADQRVVNICVLLQTLDEDGNLNNGIKISKPISTIISKVCRINKF